MKEKILDYLNNNVNNHNYQEFEEDINFYIGDYLCNYDLKDKELSVEICTTLFPDELKNLNYHINNLNNIIKK